MRPRPRAVWCTTLGCDKNLVDSEALLGSFLAAGYAVADDADSADVLVLNSCGFVAGARADSLAALRDLARAKQPGQKLVVVGCWAQEHARAIGERFPQVDLVAGVGQFAEIAAAVGRGDRQLPVLSPQAVRYTGYGERPLLTPQHVAFVKIAEGCSCHCTFCRIPLIRGPQRSRPVQEITDEVRRLVAGGVREVQIVAQNSADFGRDTGDSLLDLVRQLDRVDDLRWVRVLYLYAGMLPRREVLDILDCRRVVPYLDIPIQHASARILRAMKRPGDPQKVGRFCLDLRRQRPDLVLRTTVLLGFPGEQEQDVEELADLLAAVEFDHLGTYRYSPERGTPAARLPGRVPDEEVADREARILDLQAEIALRRQQRRLGQVHDLVVDAVVPAADALDLIDALRDGIWRDATGRQEMEQVTGAGGMVALGRSHHYGYDLDGVVLLPPAGLQPGDWCAVRFAGVTAFDAWAAGVPPAAR